MSALSDLASELGIDADTLRSRLTSGGDESEALTPNYLSTDAAGNVGANFSGQVVGGAFILRPGTSVGRGSHPPPQATQLLEWVDTGSGLLAASLWAFDDSGSPGQPSQETGFTLDAYDVNAGTPQTVKASIRGSNVPWRNVGIADVSAVADADAGTGPITRKIIDGAGTSDFLQLAQTQKLLIQVGQNQNNSDGGGWVNINLPVAFPNACLGCLMQNTFANGFGETVADVGVLSASSIRGFVNRGNVGPYVMNWLAWGN